MGVTSTRYIACAAPTGHANHGSDLQAGDWSNGRAPAADKSSRSSTTGRDGSNLFSLHHLRCAKRPNPHSPPMKHLISLRSHALLSCFPQRLDARREAAKESEVEH